MKPSDLGRLLLLAALWGGSYLFIRIAAPVLGVSLTIGLRVIIAALALVLCGAAQNGWMRQIALLQSRWRSYLLLGLLNNVIPFLLIAIAVVNLNASIAAILNATTPLFTAIVAAIWLREPLLPRKIAGLLLGIVGVLALVGWSPLPRSLPVLLGGIAALAAALSYGLAAVYARRQFIHQPAADTAIGQLVGSSLVLLPVAVISLPRSLPSIEVLLAVAALAIGCTAFAYLLYFQLIASAGATQAATVTFLIPGFSVLLGKILLNEPINAGLIVGLTLILLSVWLVIGQRRSASSQQAQ